jgi:citrate lyase subunit beta/citryl-CoA lyase
MSRSFLFIPGNTPSMLQNCDVFESDAVIIDLEDSVIVEDKDAARLLVSNFISKYNHLETDIYIRINSEDTTFFKEDVALLDTLNIKGYVLPKASKDNTEILSNLTSKDIICIVESPKAVLEMETIAQVKGVKGLLLGAEDLTKEIGISRTLEGTEILYTRSKLVLTCNAYNILSIDTPYTSKDNEPDLLKDALHAKNLGFTSKSAIHPNHVDIINTVFSPSEEEITHSLRIIKKAEIENKGAFSLDGKMVDKPIIEKAHKIIQQAKKYNLI